MVQATHSTWLSFDSMISTSLTCRSERARASKSVASHLASSDLARDGLEDLVWRINVSLKVRLVDDRLHVLAVEDDCLACHTHTRV